MVDIGRQARMECIVETADGESDAGSRNVITWMKDGQPLPNRTRIIISGRTLQIFVLQREDYGKFISIIFINSFSSCIICNLLVRTHDNCKSFPL